MPTILLINGFRLYFNSREESRMHIHISKGHAEIKVWIDNFEIATSIGFNSRERALAVKLARKYEKEIKAKWKEHFKDKA